MPFPNEHAARIRDPKTFDSFARENDKFGPGVSAIWGTKDDKTDVQAIRFDRTKFTADEAQAWLKDHDYKPIEFEPASEKRPVKKTVVEGTLDFVEGDEGTGILQTHESGLLAEAVKPFPGLSLGWDPVEVGPATLERLAALTPAAWGEAVEGAIANGDFSTLSELIGEVLPKISTETESRVVSLVAPVAIHTDIRFQKEGANFWEGAILATPGNQFRKNSLRLQGDDPTLSVPASFAVVRDEGDGEDLVVRGPLDWMQIGADVPESFPPTESDFLSGWNRFRVVDSFRWKAGVQSPDFREFFLEGGTLSGRYVFEKTADGWIFSRPELQTMKSTAFAIWSGFTKRLDVPICKSEDGAGKKRFVLGPVLIPDVVDAQKDVVNAEEIEATAHAFLEAYASGTATIGFMHKDMARDLRVVESYIARVPHAFTVNGEEKVYPIGTWFLGIHVIDADTWAGVESGEIRGFSVAGVARAKKLGTEKA